METGLGPKQGAHGKTKQDHKQNRAAHWEVSSWRWVGSGTRLQRTALNRNISHTSVTQQSFYTSVKWTSSGGMTRAGALINHCRGKNLVLVPEELLHWSRVLQQDIKSTGFTPSRVLMSSRRMLLVLFSITPPIRLRDLGTLCKTIEQSRCLTGWLSTLGSH